MLHFAINATQALRAGHCVVAETPHPPGAGGPWGERVPNIISHSRSRPIFGPTHTQKGLRTPIPWPSGQ